MVNVAQAAGVSQSTVSFVLNGRRDVVVAEATRERVLRTAAEMNYRPNRTAQSLRLDQSFLVGIVTRGIVSGPYAGRILAGVQKAVEASGQLCMVVDVSDDPAESETAVASFLAQGVSAIVYASFVPVEIQTSPLLGQTRCLFVNCWPADPADGQTAIVPDDYGGGRAAATAAFQTGHSDVAFLGGTAGEHACVERQRGFVDAARAVGINPDHLIQVNGSYEISYGFEETLATLRVRRPTALVCGNDRVAVGAILALQTLGLSVPGDVSVIGFDDQPDVADQLRPRLTTVRLPHYEMGWQAGQLLVDDAVDRPARITVPCPLVTRDSLGPPAGAVDDK